MTNFRCRIRKAKKGAPLVILLLGVVSGSPTCADTPELQPVEPKTIAFDDLRLSPERYVGQKISTKTSLLFDAWLDRKHAAVRLSLGSTNGIEGVVSAHDLIRKTESLKRGDAVTLVGHLRRYRDNSDFYIEIEELSEDHLHNLISRRLWWLLPALLFLLGLFAEGKNPTPPGTTKTNLREQP